MDAIGLERKGKLINCPEKKIGKLMMLQKVCGDSC